MNKEQINYKERLSVTEDNEAGDEIMHIDSSRKDQES